MRSYMRRIPFAVVAAKTSGLTGDHWTPNTYPATGSSTWRGLGWENWILGIIKYLGIIE